MKHLRYRVIEAPKGHPQKVMKELGITYQHATPQMIADQWWFWNCENLPTELPEYLDELIADPFKMIGYGLSKEDAEKITLAQNGTKFGVHNGTSEGIH